MYTLYHLPCKADQMPVRKILVGVGIVRSSQARQRWMSLGHNDGQAAGWKRSLAYECHNALRYL